MTDVLGKIDRHPADRHHHLIQEIAHPSAVASRISPWPLLCASGDASWKAPPFMKPPPAGGAEGPSSRREFTGMITPK